MTPVLFVLFRLLWRAAARRLLLTGTPLQNRLGELHALLTFAVPCIFGSAGSAPVFGGGDGREAVAVVRSLIEPFVLRRLKCDVLGQLPPKTLVPVLVDMTPSQAAAYEAVRGCGAAVRARA